MAETEVKDTELEDVETEEPEIEEKEEEEKPTAQSAIKTIATKVKDWFSKNETEDVDIPQDFYNAASQLGWDDDEIMDFVLDEGKRLYSDKELQEMIPILLGEDSVKTEQASDKETKVQTPETKEVKVENSQEDEQIKKLIARIDELEKAQGKHKEQVKEQEDNNLIARACQMFDEESKKFDDVFGQTDNLPTFPDGRLVPNSPQMKARHEVWEVAEKLLKSGVDVDTAMSVSLNAYKGKNLSKAIERNVIKGLREREKKLSGKRTSHESNQIIESGPELIKKMLEERGK